jgi:hypothetical protein
MKEDLEFKGIGWYVYKKRIIFISEGCLTFKSVAQPFVVMSGMGTHSYA